MSYEADLMKDGVKTSRGKIIAKIAPHSDNSWDLILSIKATNLPASGKCLCFPVINPQLEIFRT